MNKTLSLWIAVLLTLFPLSGFSQVETTKGLSGNGLELVTTLTSQPSIYADSKKNCYALAIGIPGPFHDETFKNLSFPDDDCTTFFSSINQLFRFQYEIKQFSLLHVDSIQRTSRVAFDLLENLRNQPISNGDIVFIYLSGHGLTYRNHYYFPLSDSDAKRHASMLTGAQIYEVAEFLANRGASVLIFLDTCASGSILDEMIDLNGRGGVICFPAASKDQTTKERLATGGSEFGNKLREILSGDAFLNNNVDILTVGQISELMKPVMKGGITPCSYNSNLSSIDKVVLVNDLQTIRSYNTLVLQYQSYINSGINALNKKQLDIALKSFDNATNLAVTQRQIFPNDRQEISNYINELNKEIALAIKKDASNSVWGTLANIDKNSPNLDKTIVSIPKLKLGCGRYYKNKNDLENAYVFFCEAYNNGDKTYAPYEIYLLTQNNSIPASKPLSEAERNEFLQIAAANNNEQANKILHPVQVVSETPSNYPSEIINKKGVFERVWDDITYDTPVVGISLVSDFNKYPIGLKGDFLWGPIHLGLDFSIGSSLFYSEAYAYVSTSSSITVNGEPVEPTIEYIGSEDENTRGTFAYTITPGIFYKRISIDCGLGQIWTNTSRIDTYKYTYGTSSSSSSEGTNVSTTISTSTSSTSTEKERVETKNDYFVYKPGLTCVFGDKEEFAVLISARYRICPKEKSLNGFELSAGINIPF